MRGCVCVCVFMFVFVHVCAGMQLINCSIYIYYVCLLPNSMLIFCDFYTYSLIVFIVTTKLFFRQSASNVPDKHADSYDLTDLWLSDSLDCVPYESLEWPERSFVIGWPIVNFIFTFDSVETRFRWYSALKQ